MGGLGRAGVPSSRERLKERSDPKIGTTYHSLPSHGHISSHRNITFPFITRLMYSSSNRSGSFFLDVGSKFRTPA